MQLWRRWFCDAGGWRRPTVRCGNRCRGSGEYGSSSKSFVSRYRLISFVVLRARVERARRAAGLGGTAGGFDGIIVWIGESEIGFGGTGGGMTIADMRPPWFRGESERCEVEMENGLADDSWPRRESAATSKAELADRPFTLALVST